ncbi:hypothetical protein BHM03_00015714 [Ensete ventricosum]|nr:hypothetical protein BHM03_00015714 [Ensete ventricosum]
MARHSRSRLALPRPCRPIGVGMINVPTQSCASRLSVAPKGVKDMNEAWLAKAGLSLAPRVWQWGGQRVDGSIVGCCGGRRPHRWKASWHRYGRQPEEAQQEGGSEKLMNRAAKILALRATNKELKIRTSQELVAATGRRVKELEESMEKLWVELYRTKDRGAEGGGCLQCIRGFESGLEKMGQISYEFKYRVALEWLGKRHPEVEVENDPFAKCLEDDNVKIDLCQPFGKVTL